MIQLRKVTGLVCLLALASCTDSNDLTESPGEARQVLDASEGFASYDARRPTRTAGEVADRVATLATIMDPTVVAAHDVLVSAFENAEMRGVQPAWLARPLPSNPNIAVDYHLETDDLRVSDMSLVQDYDSPAAVDENGARQVFHKVFDELASAGILERNDYDLRREHVGYTKHGSGSTIDGVTTESAPQISEYHFRVRRLLDNIEFANELIKISIHVTGRVSRVRVVGAEVGARVGSSKARVLSDADLKDRFSKDYPNGFAEWNQMLYAFPGDENSGVIEPKQVFSFSVVSESDGVPVVSRRQEARYSITSSDAEPEIWPVPRPDAVGDPNSTR